MLKHLTEDEVLNEALANALRGYQVIVTVIGIRMARALEKEAFLRIDGNNLKGHKRNRFEFKSGGRISFLTYSHYGEFSGFQGYFYQFQSDLREWVLDTSYLPFIPSRFQRIIDDE